MKRLPLAMTCLLALTLPAMAQTGTPQVSPAPRVPVVQAPAHSHAQKVPVKPAKKPSAKPAAPPAAKPEAPPPAAAAPPADPAPPPVDPNKGSVSGLPLPRFMSLRFDDVNLRVGPGTRYPIDWVYHRRDLPVEILRELDDWRLVQDQDSIRGWVRAPTLSPRRGVVIRGAERVLRSKPGEDGTAVARLKPGVIGRVRSCAADSPWCEVEVATYRGFLKRDEIFGVYPNEAIGG